MSQIMLTTVDNPFSPFTQWDEWWAFDHWHGYKCCEILGNVADTSPDLSDEDTEEAIDEAIRAIVRNDPTNMYTIAFENEEERVKELEELESLGLLSTDYDSDWD